MHLYWILLAIERKFQHIIWTSYEYVIKFQSVIFVDVLVIDIRLSLAFMF